MDARLAAVPFRPTKKCSRFRLISRTSRSSREAQDDDDDVDEAAADHETSTGSGVPRTLKMYPCASFITRPEWMDRTSPNLLIYWNGVT